ncbi:hypothetical protein E4U57_005817 [Claviceps arundinis]|uniref:Anaphase-promoting complex subunit 4-like WD40 domain-containing protein n=1 Tax=Claviceps arundinis TaxID=1623583 RepID=A0ABQ7P696_9HYPO|nr:hypothetical protein E4U57_005817 [Claviceps arundinis]
MSSASITLDRILAAAPTAARGRPTHISADPRGQRIAYASGKSIFVRSIDNPSDCKEYTGHTAATTVARFSPSGFKVASGDVSGVLRIWEPDNIDKTAGEYPITSGRLNDVAWDGESQRVIAVGDGKEQYGRCITADSGNSVGEIIGHSRSVNGVAMKGQRPLRAATVADDGNMVFYHGAPYKFNQKTALHRGFVLGTEFSPDGSMLATFGADKKVQLYHGQTGDPQRDIGEGVHTGSIFALSWSEDSSKFATASADQTIKLWDARTGDMLQSWKFGEGPSIRDQQMGVVIPHGRTDGLIISANLNGDLIYLKEGQEEPLMVLQGHSKSITALAAPPPSPSVSPMNGHTGTTLWTGSFEGRVCRWDLNTGKAIIIDGQTHRNQIVQITGSAAGRMHTASWDDTAKTVDESAATFVDPSFELPAQPRGASASKGTLYVATVSSIAVFSDKGPLLHETPLTYTPTCIASFDRLVAFDRLIAVGGEQNRVKLYKASPDGVLQEGQALENPTGTITALAFSPDGSHLAAGNSVGKIYVYKTDTWEVVSDRWSAHTARVTCISWHGSGAYAASGSLDTNVFVWCLEKKNQGKRIKAANAHKDGVNGIAWVDGHLIASAGGDANVKLWNVKNLP